MAVEVLEAKPAASKKDCKFFGKMETKYKILTGVIVTQFVVILLMLVLMITHTDSTCFQEPPSLTESVELPQQAIKDPKVNVSDTDLNYELKIIPRRTWLAQPPTQEPSKLKLPVPYVIIMHTASDQCKDQADCVFAVRHIQSFHIESNGWWDIGHNFLIGGDGLAYEGRGWKAEGAYTYGYNSLSIGIAFIGTYNTTLPTQAQLIACKQLIEQGVKNGDIAKNYKLLGARQVSSTSSPGLMLYEEIKKWPHWSPEP